MGFIGSHTVASLQEKGHEVLIVDDLSNATIEVLDGIEARLVEKDLFGNKPSTAI